MNVEEEIDRAARFGQQMEDLVYNEAEDGKVIYRTEDDDLLIAYWSLILDYSKGIDCLLKCRFHYPSFTKDLVTTKVLRHVV